MNYLKQILGFKRRRLGKPLSSNAICLYYILLEYANDLCFPDSFTASNAAISSLCSFSVETLRRRREELCEKGYITYSEGETGKCGRYSIAPLSHKIWDKSDAESEEEVWTLNKYKYIDKYNISNAHAGARYPSALKPRKLFFSYGSDDDDEC